MTAKELIADLKELPDDAEVILRTYDEEEFEPSVLYSKINNQIILTYNYE